MERPEVRSRRKTARSFTSWVTALARPSAVATWTGLKSTVAALEKIRRFPGWRSELVARKNQELEDAEDDGLGHEHEQ